MSNIEPNIIDPGKGPPPPDVVPDLPIDDHVGSDDIKEPNGDPVPIDPDPEDGGKHLPDDIERT